MSHSVPNKYLQSTVTDICSADKSLLDQQRFAYVCRCGSVRTCVSVCLCVRIDNPGNVSGSTVNIRNNCLYCTLHSMFLAPGGDSVRGENKLREIRRNSVLFGRCRQGRKPPPGRDPPSRPGPPIQSLDLVKISKQ